MSQKLIEELKRENLSTHFILPLLRLNKFSFVASNFVNTYLTRDRQIVVEVMEKYLVHGKCMLHKQFQGILTDHKGHYFYVYKIPSKWYPEIDLFTRGKFSDFSDLAKETIRVQSGLPVNKIMASGVPETDARLLALDRHKVVREMWERVIAPAKKITGELLSIPDEKKLYIQLDLLAPETGEIPINTARE